jgi:hypothetical protein
LRFLSRCFAASWGCAQAPDTSAQRENFKTIYGNEYKDATVSRVEPGGVKLKTKSGISKVYFVELQKDVQERSKTANDPHWRLSFFAFPKSHSAPTMPQ